ncbi:potassium channel subfamily K member 6 [Amia ocellicauda]|uniref:potassium channel subfamily K member 6 n=1 Tax=Amia ocellicauda TaxID=2972642 RepID=UPI00346437DF|nr:KCNK6 protein [Amia calva]
MSSTSRSWVLLLVFILFYVTFLFLGALIFSAIERPEETRLRSELRALKEHFLNQSCVNETSLEIFLEKVLKANKYGVSVLQNSSLKTNWDFASSLFFASTLVTTVGYGHTTPLSDGGKAFSIVFALLGVPFTMLVLTASVQRLMHQLTYRTVAMCQRKPGLEQRTAATVHFIVMLALSMVIFFVIPAVIFTAIEETWSYLDSFYFCFISLCTIGLGDYVPGEQPDQKLRSFYKIAVMVYLFLGLMGMFLLLRTFHKLADLYGLTSFFHLPHCEEDEDEEPIVNAIQDSSNETDKVARKPLDVNSQVSYSSINR